MRRAVRRVELLILVPAVAAAIAVRANAEDVAAQLFAGSCAACHTIGQGAGIGPDLLSATQRPKESLRVSVKKMEETVGPLTEAQVDGLVDLLKSSDLNQRLAALAQPAAEETVAAVELPRGSEPNGRRLFFGERPLAHGGPPCFACHAVASRGGNLAVDLTSVQARIGPSALMSATATPPFPMMKAAYAKRQVTQQEALDLAAFLESSAIDHPSVFQPPPERVLPVHLGALSFAGVIFGAAGLLFRSRRAGVRSRLVRDSSRR